MELPYTPNVGITDVILFILANRDGSNCFRNWPVEAICGEIYKAHNERNLYITKDNDRITGMIVARVIDDKTFRVDHLLCASKAAFRQFRAIGKYVFGGRMVIYTRRGKEKSLRKY